MISFSPDIAVRNNVIGYHHHHTPNENNICCATPAKIMFKLDMECIC